MVEEEDEDEDEDEDEEDEGEGACHRAARSSTCAAEERTVSGRIVLSQQC